MAKFVEIDGRTLNELKFLKNKTGVGAFSILRTCDGNRPSGLRAHDVQDWLEGRITRAPVEQLDFVLERWREIWRCGAYLVALDDRILAELRSEEERCGVSLTALLKGASVPAGLSPGTVRNWMSGAQKSARKAQLDWVLDAYAQLPDKEDQTRLSREDYELYANSARIALTPPMIEAMGRLRRETGKSPMALLKWAKEAGLVAPPNLTANVIAGWLNGRVQTAEAQHLHFVQSAWADALDMGPRFIPVTQKMHEDLISWRAKGLLPAGIFSKNWLSPKRSPKGLSSTIVQYWIDAPARRVREDWFEWVVGQCAALENSPHYRVTLSEEIRRDLKKLRYETGIWQTELLRFSQNKPDDLSVAMVGAWMDGTTRTAKREHLDWTLSAWRAVKDDPQTIYAARPSEAMPVLITLSEGDIERLSALLDDCGMGVQSALRKARNPRPEGLSTKTVQDWISGSTRRARRDHFAYVIDTLSELIDTRKSRIKLTHERRAALKAEMSRTGVGVVQLVRQLRAIGDLPTPEAIAHWISGRTQSCERSAYERVLQFWRNLPDLSPSIGTELGLGQVKMYRGRIVLTKEVLGRLHDLHRRADMGGTAMMKYAKKNVIAVPKGFTIPMVRSWLSGKVRSVPPEYLAFAVEIWRACQKPQIDWKEIDGRDFEILSQHRKQGYLPSRVFEAGLKRPDGLTPAVISRWLREKPKRLRSDYWNWVMEACDKLHAAPDRRIAITPEFTDELIRHRTQSGVSQTDLLKDADDVPDGLSIGTISAWINGNVATARLDHMDYVRARWRELAKKMTG